MEAVWEAVWEVAWEVAWEAASVAQAGVAWAAAVLEAAPAVWVVIEVDLVAEGQVGSVEDSMVEVIAAERVVLGRRRWIRWRSPRGRIWWRAGTGRWRWSRCSGRRNVTR